MSLGRSATWVATGWWRVVGPDGELWCESSDEQENRSRMRPGDTLYRHEQRVEQRWTEVVSMNARDFAEAQRLLRENDTDGLKALAARSASGRAADAAARARSDSDA